MASENKVLSYDGQINFAGGCWMVGAIPANGYRWAKNIVIRDGKAKTRPGFRAAFKNVQAGFNEAFYFNEDNAKYNDSTHTGFWFPFDFVGSSWGSIQGMGVIRFLGEDKVKIVLASEGRVYVHDQGYVKEVSTAETIATTESISFIQAMNKVFMFRGENNNVLQWDGGPEGFIAVPTPKSGSPIVNGTTATFMAGRLWIPRNRDDIYASDVLDHTAYDYVYQLFSISSGDGNEITRIVEFHEDTALVFKDRAIYYIMGINSSVMGGTHLSDYIKIGSVDTDHGLVAKNAVVKYGEQVAYLSYRGICTIARNAQGKLEGISAPLSAPIQPIIDRINWGSVSCACATFFNNYLLFGVPIDGKTYNNTVLVYDVLLGAWVGEWQSEWLRPVQFYVIDEELYFLGTDGRLRIMFQDDPWDSEDVSVDIAPYLAATQYYAGEHVTYDSAGGDERIYKALVDTQGNLPTDTDYWEEEPDDSAHVLCAVKSELWTKFYDWNDPTTGKRFQRGEVLFEHQNPLITIQAESEMYNTVKDLLSDKTYDRTKYDICDTDDWLPSNVNLDYRNPHRQDYTVFLEESFYVDNIVTNGNAEEDLDGWSYLYNPPTPVTFDGATWFSIPSRSTIDFYQNVDITIGKTYKIVWDMTSGIKTISCGGVNVSDTATFEIIPYGSGVVIRWTNYFVATTKEPLSISVINGSLFTYYIRNITLYGGSLGMYTDSTGIPLNIWTKRSHRFIPIMSKDKSMSLRIKNDMGKLAVKSIRLSGTYNRFANRRT